MLPLKQELEQRGLLKQFTDEKLFDLYDKGGQTFYFGMDPTADSLHLGNYINFINAVHLMRRGNTLIPLVGGATGMIGDPGGKDAEREFLDETTLAHNFEAISTQVTELINNIEEFLGEELEHRPVLNNKDFYRDLSFLDFLRDTGKHITVNSMMTRDTVSKRLTEADKSISYTEFSYMLIQGHDFYRLYTDQDCKLQISGSDQRGNITIGTELIRKKAGGEVYGFTCPLIVDSHGKKFGKSAGNAIFLNPEKNSPYQMYQYFLNTTDEDLEKFLKLLTFYSFEKIETILEQHKKYPELRYGQQSLAQYVVALLAGKQAVQQAKMITEILYGKNDRMDIIATLTKEDIEALSQELGSYTLQDNKENIIDVLVNAGLAESRGQAKKLLQSGGVYINEKKVSDSATVLDDSYIVNNRILLRRGKKAFRVLHP